MNIPVILDITLGLLLIFLVLSLLASEIQEIIGTLLQWRAEHLKKSIELLLSGETDQDPTGQRLADLLYGSPLLRSLNQEAQGPISGSLRKITQAIGSTYRSITRTRNTFGNQHSGPSYIPPGTFAATLLDTLNIQRLSRCLTSARLEQFAEEQLWLPVRRVIADLRASLGDDFLLQSDVQELEQQFRQSLRDFNQNRTNARLTVDRFLNQLDIFIRQVQSHVPAHDDRVQATLQRLTTLREWLAQDDRAKLATLSRIEPNLQELLGVLDQGSAIYQECLGIIQQGRLSPELRQELHQIVNRLQGEVLPEHLQRNLFRLVDRIDARVDSLDDKLDQLETEIAGWFDRGMERATGVYRRNARGVALILGIAIAATLNADAFFMVSRLAKDPAIRDSITQAALQITPSADIPVEQTLLTLRNSVDSLIDDLPLPIGRSQLVMQLQAQDESNWPLPIARHYFGWLVTGLAISMGSAFWFGLIGRVLQVRNAGDGPKNPEI